MFIPESYLIFLDCGPLWVIETLENKTRDKSGTPVQRAEKVKKITEKEKEMLQTMNKFWKNWGDKLLKRQSSLKSCKILYLS